MSSTGPKPPLSEIETKLTELCLGFGVCSPELDERLGSMLRKTWCINEEDVNQRDLVFQIVQLQLELLIETLDANRTDVEVRAGDKNVARILFNISIPDVQNLKLTDRYRWCDSLIAKEKYSLPRGNTLRKADQRGRIIKILANELQKRMNAGILPSREDILQRIEDIRQGQSTNDYTTAKLQGSTSRGSVRGTKVKDRSKVTSRKKKKKTGRKKEPESRSFGNIGTYIERTDIVITGPLQNPSESSLDRAMSRIIKQLERLNTEARAGRNSIPVEPVAKSLTLASRAIADRNLTAAKSHIEHTAVLTSTDRTLYRQLLVVAEEVQQLIGQ
jgi:hypothetical protein